MGLLGGFAGPYALGALHDHLGPRCPTTANASIANLSSALLDDERAAAAPPPHCITEWALALLLIGKTALALTALAWRAARVLGLGRAGAPSGSGGSSNGYGSRTRAAEDDWVELRRAEARVVDSSL